MGNKNEKLCSLKERKKGKEERLRRKLKTMIHRKMPNGENERKRKEWKKYTRREGELDNGKSGEEIGRKL